VEPLRIGILGAARIAEAGIVAPAKALGARLVGVAARDRVRAEGFAAQHGVERVFDTYEQMIEDPSIDVIYNPLANALHGPWNIRAFAAGKHVLTEKPSASNLSEARDVASVAASAGLAYMEAFHYLFHPVFKRAQALVAEGAIGELRRVATPLLAPAPPDDDARWQWELAGGATMDLGCYGLHAVRTLGSFAGGEPVLTSARAGERTGHPGVDEWLTAELSYPSGAVATVGCHMAANTVDLSLTLTGTSGSLRIANFVLPHLDDRIEVSSGKRQWVEHLGTTPSYTYQLRAFDAHIRYGSALAIGVEDSLLQMSLIDAAYEAAGLPCRPRRNLADVPSAGTPS
jgi:predicted dehydrogenase